MDEKQKGQEDDTKALFRKCSGDADFDYFLCKILADLNFASMNSKRNLQLHSKLQEERTMSLMEKSLSCK